MPVITVCVRKNIFIRFFVFRCRRLQELSGHDFNSNGKRGLDRDDLFDDVETDVSPLHPYDRDQIMTVEDDDDRASAPFYPTRTYLGNRALLYLSILYSFCLYCAARHDVCRKNAHSRTCY